MKISELDLVFGQLSQRFENLGLVQTKVGEYAKEFEKPNVLRLEFVSERYDSGMNILVSGPFSNQDQLVLGILANAVAPEEAKEIRLQNAAKHGHRIVSAVLSFLEKHASDLTENPDDYLAAYSQAIHDLRRQHGFRS